MIVTRKQIVETARTYIGTPWVHQGRQKGWGVDCVGLTICIALDLQLISKQDVSSMPRDYGKRPDMAYMRKTVSRYMDSVWPPKIGDWVYLSPMIPNATQLLAEPTHLAMISSDKSIIHADSDNNSVVEHPFRMGAMKLAKGAYRYRGLSDE